VVCLLLHGNALADFHKWRLARILYTDVYKQVERGLWREAFRRAPTMLQVRGTPEHWIISRLIQIDCDQLVSCLQYFLFRSSIDQSTLLADWSRSKFE